jgi:hypothetical protein
VSFDWATILVQLVVSIIVNLIFVAPSLWIAGRLLAGKQNAKLTDALWIVTLGTVIFYFFNLFLAGYLTSWLVVFGSWIAAAISYLVMLIIWLALVKHFFDCGWLKAFAISIIAIIIAIVIWLIIFFVLTLIGIGTGWIPQQFPSI